MRVCREGQKKRAKGCQFVVRCFAAQARAAPARLALRPDSWLGTGRAMKWFKRGAVALLGFWC